MKNYAKEYQEQKVNFIYSLLGLCFEGTTEEDANKFINENYEKANDIYWDMIDQDIDFVQEYRFITEKQEKEIDRICNKHNVKFNGSTYEQALLFIYKYNNIDKLIEEENNIETITKVIPNSKILEQVKTIEKTLNSNCNKDICICDIKTERVKCNELNIIRKEIDKKKQKLKEEYEDIIKSATSKYNSSVPKVYKYTKYLKRDK